MLKLASQARTAKRLLKMRGLRWDYFNGELFDEHAWNMLLLLFIAHAEERGVSSHDLRRDSGASASVGPRWITHLVNSQLIDCAGDGDHALVSLTADTRAELGDYLFEVQRLFAD